MVGNRGRDSDYAQWQAERGPDVLNGGSAGISAGALVAVAVVLGSVAVALYIVLVVRRRK
ncbi:hypothetical protein SA2016_1029 [Sinomonas atrocyanea]|uniref:Uncharacterized protein n=1 Tax=Sinomonas atrocyanea TaxID=37927 RepID=A0A126ZX81_9MICC|nr:hypothetical protein SA2016_1029 [Sinomonas atrocyanea]GEB66114.1 hypothetical protein SAT01_35620 [Sinomonas atrocyanea]GGG59473.1 hypothetical protein GCM10007172_07920 [Sinomonas atrocyanea]